MVTIDKPPSLLTPRELQVAKLIAEGSSSKEIAVRLGISVNTVTVHKAKIFEKLEIHDRVLLAMWALRNKVISL